MSNIPQWEAYEKFENNLKEKFPKIFNQTHSDVSCGQGWWPIIENLCRQIQGHIDWRNEQVEKYQRGTCVEQVHVMQIKEKFGGLRFYYNGGDEYISGLVAMAEVWAGRTCEVCGAVGESRTEGWIKTLCEVHHQEREQQRKERYGNK